MARPASPADSMATLGQLGIEPARLLALQGLVPSLHLWFDEHRRDLPWRQTRDPYAIWISEVMLQQTQVSTVLPYYRRWMAALPDLTALAAAESERVLQLWEGLGYYSRALNLRRAAGAVVRRGGQLPRTARELRELPGVGPYTAAAIASLAWDEAVAVVDGNVRRVLCRLIALEQDPRAPATAAALEVLARELLPAPAAALHNQAMMELGALVCAPRGPRCPDCPLAGACAARACGEPQRFPLAAARRKLPEQEVAVGIVLRAGRCLIARRPEGALLGGLWEFPGGKLEAGESPVQALLRELAEEVGAEVEVARPLSPVKHAYTHLKVILHPFVCRFRRWKPGGQRAAEADSPRWVTLDQLVEYPMPRANRKILAQLEGRAGQSETGNRGLR